MSDNHLDLTGSKAQYVFAGLMAVFITFVVLTNTVGVKLFAVGDLALPVSILWFPITFLVTDITSEIFGSRRANFMVVVGFGMSLILLAAVMAGLSLAPSPIYAAEPAYQQVFAPTWRLLFASMTAYLLAQSADVRLFHFFRRLTRGRHLWLRNNGSTAISQLIDTVTVTFIFLYENPAVFSGTTTDLWQLVFSLYAVKLLIAVLDTPFCYLGVFALSRFLKDKEPASAQPTG